MIIIGSFSDDILYIAISQDGHSVSTIKVVNQLVDKNIDFFVITSDGCSPVAKTGAELILKYMPQIHINFEVYHQADCFFLLAVIVLVALFNNS